MPIVRVPLNRINDWDSFHTVFAEVLGFPAFYGRNMNAWIDCLTSADHPEQGMTTVVAGDGDVVTLQLDGIAEFARRCPEQYDALIQDAGFVNWSRVKMGERPILALSFRYRD
jgi:hypothetical protein